MTSGIICTIIGMTVIWGLMTGLGILICKVFGMDEDGGWK